MKRILLGIVITILLCSFFVLGEQIYTEISFRNWLRQNDYRFDFSMYESQEQLREALFAKLPLGSSEEEIKAFHLANADEWSKWELKKVSNDQNDIVLRIVMVPSVRHSNILNRTGNKWIVLFLLDPANRTLVDIKVEKFNGPQWP